LSAMKRIFGMSLCAVVLFGCSGSAAVRSTAASPISNAGSTAASVAPDGSGTGASSNTGATPAATSPSGDTSSTSNPATPPTTPTPSETPATPVPVATTPSPPFQPAALQWATCTKEKKADVPPGADCATLIVPLDYANPSGATVHLELIRLKASGSKKKIGSLLFNPGGPGGSGVQFFELDVVQLLSDYSPDLGSDFDLIGFDPRGVGLSDPITCVDGAFYERTAYLDDTPDTPAETAALDAARKEFGDACIAKYGTTLANYSTLNTAKDMDVIREAVGDDQLNYIGVSYGTFLGATYANLFPTRVRAMVLDGAYDPTKDDPFTAAETQLVGFEHAFGNWAKHCQDDAACPFHAADVGARWETVLKQLEAQPIAASDGRLANDAVLRTATSLAMYSADFWPELDQALADAATGKVDGLFALSDLEWERNAKNDWNNIQQAFLVISCASGFSEPFRGDLAAAQAKLKTEAPHFATATDLLPMCAELGIADPAPAALSTYTGSGPLLVVGGKNDPATPFRWATQMVADLGGTVGGNDRTNVALLTFTGEGHATFLSNTCATHQIATLIETAHQAADGIVCDVDKAVPAPAVVGTLPPVPGTAPFDFAPFRSLFRLQPTKVFSLAWTTDVAPAAVGGAYSKAWKGLGFSTQGGPGSEGVFRTDFVRDSDGVNLAVIAIGADTLGKDTATAGLVAAMGTAKTLVLMIVFAG
jgi:pimeloyl-ACP methyl ester carboxylesterase